MTRPADVQPPNGDAMIRLVLVEPRAMVGIGVRDVLDREPDIEVVAEVRSADEAMLVVEATEPTLVVVDVTSQDVAAVDDARRLAEAPATPAMVVIDSQDDDINILGAVEAGATARIAEVAEPAELVAVIRRVADGEEPLNDELTERPDLVRRIVEGARDGTFGRGDRPSVNLTLRELEVLRCVADGMRNREIAGRLEVSEQTVKNHLSTIMHKLGVPNRTHAVTYAVRQGWLVLDGGATVSQGPAA